MDKREHFFKIVHDNAIREGKLGIPKKFIRKYGNDLTSPAILKVPCGAVWKVELLKGDDEVWFEKGWGEFAKYYSLEYGYLLVFQYMGQSNFQVVILDKSAVEIQYPYDRVCAAEPKHDWDFQEAKAQANEENISVEALDDQSLKKIRIDSTSKTPNISLSGNLPTCTSAHGHGDLKQDQQAKRRSCSSTSSALEAVNNFVSENPFFKAVVNTRCPSICVPISFSRSYVQGQQVSLTLQVSDRSWTVKFVKRAPGKPGRITFGWPVFIKENLLGDGDVCIFELIEKKLLKVSIFRCVK